MAGSESKRAKGIGGPPGSLLWWISQVAGLVVSLVLVLVALTGLIMRDEFLGVALISFPLAVLCGWVAQREMRHHVPDRTSSSDGSDTPVDITPLD